MPMEWLDTAISTKEATPTGTATAIATTTNILIIMSTHQADGTDIAHQEARAIITISRKENTPMKASQPGTTNTPKPIVLVYQLARTTAPLTLEMETTPSIFNQLEGNLPSQWPNPPSMLGMATT